MADQRDIWGFPIDWSRGVEEEIAFRTKIITSRNGTEQRIAQRVKPRVTYSFYTLLSRGNIEAASRRLAEGQGRTFYLPHPSEYVTTREFAPAGTDILRFWDDHEWFEVGKKIAIIRNRLEPAELGEIFDIIDAGASFHIDAPLLKDYPINSRVMQVRVGRFVEGLDIRAGTTTAAEALVQFAADPVELELPDYGLAPETYNGAELFTLKPNWAGGIQQGFRQDRVDLDHGRGAVDAFFPVDYTTRTVQLQYTLRNSEQIDRLLGLYYRCRGRQKSFYFPIGMSELRPLFDTPDLATTMTFRGRELFDAYESSTMYHRIALKLRDGTLLTRDVSSITLDGSENSIFTVTAALPAIPLSDLLWAGWLCRVRFASDLLSLQWLTDGVAQATITLVTLEDSL